MDRRHSLVTLYRNNDLSLKAECPPMSENKKEQESSCSCSFGNENFENENFENENFENENFENENFENENFENENFENDNFNQNENFNQNDKDENNQNENDENENENENSIFLLGQGQAVRGFVFDHRYGLPWRHPSSPLHMMPALYARMIVSTARQPFSHTSVCT